LSIAAKITFFASRPTTPRIRVNQASENRKCPTMPAMIAETP
jgi:hypothetical protein